DWGRDAMISLPGLTLATGRTGLARSLLETYAGLLSDGRLPNYFPDDGGPPSYESVDAALWFIVAAHRYMEATGDEVVLKDCLGEACRTILSAYEAGTSSAIRMDADGLLAAGEPGSHLTWMDAKAGDGVITPRHGKPVEVNALWYNALRIGAAFAARLGWTQDAYRWTTLADRVRRRFDEAFWYEEGGYCYDLVRADECDTSLRPNQLFALSLPFPLLDGPRRSSVLAVVTAHLLTPMGLRTLSPFDPRYKGRHGKTLWEQDAAYHQGTVWAFLMGPYIDAYLAVHGNGPHTRTHARRLLAPLLDHLRDACVGSVSELFDGDPPHAPQGCVAQAWSVAELLRVLTRLER
ncbi:MAG: amylo-alpha-1,6-glucosidase, partial [Candidatus Tectimicrobiota bacterium]